MALALVCMVDKFQAHTSQVLELVCMVGKAQVCMAQGWELVCMPWVGEWVWENELVLVVLDCNF